MKKLLSVLLSLALIVSVIGVGTLNVTAETTEFTVKLLNHYSTEQKNDINKLTEATRWDIKYPDNLFEDGEFNNISSAVTNATYIPNNTDNGSNGSYQTIGDGAASIQLPELEAQSYYLVRVGVKGLVNGLWGDAVLFYESDKEKVKFNPGNEVKNTEKIYVFLVATAAATNTACVKIKKASVTAQFDNVGVHKISQEEYNTFNTATYTTDNPLVITPTVEYYSKQFTQSSSKNLAEISNYSLDWSRFGENLIPDPQVANFDENGVYGTYAVADANNSYLPKDVNQNNWWDKYIDVTTGFVNAYDNDDSTAVTASYQSPKQRGILTSEYSISNDGTGSIMLPSSAKSTEYYMPLPKLEGGKYYVIKYQFQQNASSPRWDTEHVMGYVDEKNATGLISLHRGYLTEDANGGVPRTVAMAIYTGTNQYTNAYLRFNRGQGETDIYLDDFGMYEVSKEVYEKLTPEQVIPNDILPANNDAELKQFSTTDTAYYAPNASLEWSLFGENLVESGLSKTFTRSGQQGIQLGIEFEKQKQYLIKYDIKVNSGSAVWKNVPLLGDFDIDWKSATTYNSGYLTEDTNKKTVIGIISTNNTEFTNPYLNIYSVKGELVVDNICVYEISDEQYETFKAVETADKLANPTIATEGLSLSLIDETPIDYQRVDWDLFGDNLIPDPTVNNFVDGEYGTYATPNSNYSPTNENPTYWWDRWVDNYHGFNRYYAHLGDGGTYDTFDQKTLVSPKQRGVLCNNESLTDDGSGSIKITESGDYKMPIPSLDVNKYYVIKCDVKVTGRVGWSVARFCYSTGSHSYDNGGINLGNLNSLNNVKTLVFAVYTGSNSIKLPCIQVSKAEATELYVDNFGLYEVDKDFFAQLKTESKLPDDVSYGDANGDKEIDICDLVRADEFNTDDTLIKGYYLKKKADFYGDEVKFLEIVFNPIRTWLLKK